MTLSYATIKQALAGRRLPAAFVDLDAFDRNAAHVADSREGVDRIAEAGERAGVTIDVVLCDPFAACP